MYSFPNLGTVCCPMSGSNCCFLTCIRFLRRQIRWSGIPISLRIFPASCDPHSQRFSIVNEAEVDAFLEFPCFFYMTQGILAIWSLAPLPFLNPAFMSVSSQFMYCWSLAWRILSITLLACEMSVIVWQFDHSLALPFFGIRVKPYDPAIPLVGIYPKKTKTIILKDICNPSTPGSLQHYLTTPKIWKQPTCYG